MENISYVGLSQQLALMREMEVTANNIANMNTPGYKTQKVMFLEYLNRAKMAGAPDNTNTLKQVMDYASYRDLSAGPLHQTHNTLDFAIQGDGFFAVDGPGGVKYTRDGSFSLNSNGEIVSQAGYPLLDDAGAPIIITPEAGQVSLTREGDIVTNEGIVGRVKLVTFDEPQKLQPIGENLFDAIGTTEKPVEDRIVIQGMVEKSNVNPVVEMNKMIEVLRLYQATARMMNNDHERMRSAIQKLSKV